MPQKLFSPQASLLYIQALIGFVWLKSGWGKLSGGDFPQVLAKTLEYFASKNPYPWYQNFLEQAAVPNVEIFARLTQWGELAAGLLLTITAVWQLQILLSSGKPRPATGKSFRLATLVGLLIAIFLNLTFYLAAGWTGVSTATLNWLMAGIEAIIFFRVII